MEATIESKVKGYARYKDSGVECLPAGQAGLGEIPEHWETVKLKYIIESRTGYAFPSEKFSLPNTDGIPVVRISDLNIDGIVKLDKCPQLPLDFSKYIENYGLKKNDILFAMTGGTIGKVARYTNNSVSLLNQRVCSFTIDDKILRKIIFYWMNSSFWKDYVDLKAKGGAQPNISDVDVLNLNICISNKKEQTAIANFLDDKTQKIDQAIGIKKQQIALLKERKQILIHKAVTRGLDDSVAFKDSGVEWIGEIPAHWEVKKLKYVLKTQGRIGFKGYTTSDLVSKEEGALVLGASHLDWEGNINLEKPVYISWKKYYESPEIMVSKKDVIIVQRGSTCGKVALIDKDYGPTTINPSLVLLKEIIGYPQYMFLGIKVVLNEILNLVSKTAIPMLSQFQIDNIEIPFPDKKEQKEISSYIESASQKIDTAIGLKQREIEKLKEYKGSLVNSCVTGKIKIT